MNRRDLALYQDIDFILGWPNYVRPNSRATEEVDLFQMIN